MNQGSEVRQPEIPRNVANLGASIEEMQDHVEQLVDRLNAVLGEDSRQHTATSPEQPAEDTTPMGHQITLLDARVRGVNSRMAEILDRLEVS